MRRVVIVVAIVLAALGLAFISPVEGQQSTTTIPSSVASDCSKDVTAAVVGFIQGAANGQTVKLQPGGCYVVNQTLGFVGKTGVTFDGNAGTIRKTTLPTECGQQSHLLRISGSTRTTVMGLRLEVRDGSEFKYTDCHAFEHAISVLESTGTTLTTLGVDGPHGDCLYIRGAVGLSAKDVACNRAMRQGIGFVKGTDAVFDNFDMTNVIRSGLDFEPNDTTQTIQGVRLLNSTIAVGNLPVTSQGRNAPIRDITIKGNTVTRGKGFVWGHQTSPSGPTADDCRKRTETRSNWEILDNQVSGVGQYGGATIVLCAVQGATIAGNTIAGDAPVLLEATSGVAVKLNRFPGSLAAYREVVPLGPAQACGNVLLNGLDKPCSGTPPPPPSSTTTTTRPPPSSTTTTTTRPPVTLPPPVGCTGRCAELRDALQAVLDRYR